MTEQQIKEFLNEKKHDVRISHNSPRWIDQKCTPDILWSIADFILDYINKNGDDSTFTPKIIWESDYATEFIREEFSKPDATDEMAANEYDKVFSQPMNLFCFAGILNDISTTSRHLYKVANKEMLRYVARNDTFAYRFLCLYIEKVLQDSGLLTIFDEFFEQQNNTYYSHLKTGFESFCMNYTKIRNSKECNRIFTKVINPLACKRMKKGTKGGRLSTNIIPKQELMYNRDNFRDIYADKPKNITRKEWLESQNVVVNKGLLNHQMVAAKKILREYNDAVFNGESELTRYISDQNDSVAATQAHHIFPKSDFPTIMAFLENLIMLTPSQHFVYAHPNNKTSAISLEAQKDCLIAKTQSIKENLSSETQEHIYSFAKFLEVLATGWDKDSVYEIEENNYLDVVHEINVHYATLQ